IPDQRFAADDGDVKRTVLADQRENALDQFLSLEIADLTQRSFAAEMVVAVRIAARTLERTFAGDLDRQSGRVARQDPAPRGDDPFHSATIAGSGAGGGAATWRQCYLSEVIDSLH